MCNFNYCFEQLFLSFSVCCSVIILHVNVSLFQPPAVWRAILTTLTFAGIKICQTMASTGHKLTTLVSQSCFRSFVVYTALVYSFFTVFSFLAATCGPLGKLQNRQMAQKRSIFAGEMHSTICLEWAADHFGLGLTLVDPF